jgi:hypothetical protein
VPTVVIEDEEQNGDDNVDDAGGIESLELIIKVSKGMNETDGEKLMKYKLAAKALVNANVELHPETLDFTTLSQRLRESAAGNFKGDAIKLTYRGIFFDSKVSGQTSTAPHLRDPPLRKSGEHVKGLVKLVCQTFGGLCDTDLFFIADAGKPGNHPQLLGGFLDGDGNLLQKQKRVWTIVYEESSCQTHKDLVRGFTTINQVESLLIISATALKLSEHARLHCPGTNRGNVIGPFTWPNAEQQWKASVSKKKEIIGTDGIILVGGANPIETKSADKVKKKGTTDRRVYVQRVSHKPSHDRHKRAIR